MLRVCICGVYSACATLLTVGLQQALAERGLAILVTVETADPKQLIVFNRPPDPTRIVLLLGLDCDDPVAQVADLTIRGKLAQAGQPFEVLYGASQERQRQALECIERHLASLTGLPVLQGKPATTRTGSKASHLWTWMCDKCSDPVCEHRLLSDLLAARLT